MCVGVVVGRFVVSFRTNFAADGRVNISSAEFAPDKKNILISCVFAYEVLMVL